MQCTPAGDLCAEWMPQKRKRVDARPEVPIREPAPSPASRMATECRRERGTTRAACTRGGKRERLVPVRRSSADAEPAAGDVLISDHSTGARHQHPMHGWGGPGRRGGGEVRCVPRRHLERSNQSHQNAPTKELPIAHGVDTKKTHNFIDKLRPTSTARPLLRPREKLCK